MRKHLVVRYGIQPLALTKPTVPVVANGHMPYLIPKNDVQNVAGRKCIGFACGAELLLDQGSGVKTASLQGARDQSHARGNVVSRFLAHAPKPVMSREFTVTRIELRAQVLMQEAEVIGFLGGYAHPVSIESLWH